MKGRMDSCKVTNTQVAVEPVFQLIVGQTVTQAANDKQQLVPLIEAIPRTIGTESGRSCGGQWVLFGGKSEVPSEEKDGRVRSDEETETR